LELLEKPADYLAIEKILGRSRHKDEDDIGAGIAI
jgi:hypothetical protein